MPQSEITQEELLAEIRRLKTENESLNAENYAIKKEKADFEVLIATNIEHSDYITEDLISSLESVKLSLLEKIEKLRQEVAFLQVKLSEAEREKADLEMMIQLNAEHSDQLEDDLIRKADAALRESEQRFRLISETIPIPIFVSLVSDSSILYANRPAASFFGVSLDNLLKQKAAGFFDAEYRTQFTQMRSEQNYELKGKKSDSTPFWGDVFMQPLMFNNQQCLIAAIYDTTERRKAEEEIHRLNRELEAKEKEKEGKYLTFMLAGEEYGIHIARIRNIVPIMPITSVPRTPDYIRGMINLRGKVIPVADLRRKFGLNAADYTSKTCILITEICSGDADKEVCDKYELIGFIADSVSEVLNVRGRDIREVDAFSKDIRHNYILGFTVVREKMILLLRIDKIIGSDDIRL